MNNKIGLNNFSNGFIIVIFITFPFWEVLTAQFNYFANIPSSVFGILKYLIVILPIMLLFFRTSKHSFMINKSALLLLAYALYVLFHVVGDSHFALKLEGLRYEFLIPFLALIILSQIRFTPVGLTTLIRILFIQGFIVVAVASYEFFDQNILSLLYRKSLDELPHITWFSIGRLISTVGNPINLGASLIIWSVSCFYFACGPKGNRIKFALPIVITLSLFVITMTLSRTSMITFAFVLATAVCLNIARINLKTFFPLIFIILISVILSPIVEYFNIDLLVNRFGNLIFSSEYSENARVSNWQHALATLQGPEYLWGKGLGASTPNIDHVEQYGGLMIESGFISTFINYGALGLMLYISIMIRFIFISTCIRRFDRLSGSFLLLFLMTFVIFNIVNDYNRNLPFSLYYWIFYCLAELMYNKKLMEKRNVANILAYYSDARAKA